MTMFTSLAIKFIQRNVYREHSVKIKFIEIKAVYGNEYDVMVKTEHQNKTYLHDFVPI